MSHINASPAKLSFLTEAVKAKLVADIEAQLRAAVQPEVDRMLKAAAVEAAAHIKVRLSVEQDVRMDRTEVRCIFDGVELPINEDS